MRIKTVGKVLGITAAALGMLGAGAYGAFRMITSSWAEIGKFSEEETALLETMETGSFSFAGISRDYMLYMPKNMDGTEKRGVPLMVWNIGGTEYGMDIRKAASANRAIVCMDTAGVDCAVLVFALDNPNYEFSASLYPEKLMQIDRNNALQAAFIQTLIEAGRIDGEHVYCAGASSGGGATVRFCMQFPELFAAAVPCCSMDPIVPIHKVKEQYEGQFVHDLKAAFQGQVYRWDGSEMVLEDIDTEDFLSLPMTFVHAREDFVCKVTSSLAMYEARRELGASEDQIRIYEHEEMAAYGIRNRLLSHLSWVPLQAEFGEGTTMGWMLAH